MDEFGVLVESMGFKALAKSVPMVELKAKPKSNSSADRPIHAPPPPPPLNYPSLLPVDELDVIFRPNCKINGKTEQSLNLLGEDDVFCGPVPASNQYREIDLETVFNNSVHRKNDDLFGPQLKQTDSGDDKRPVFEDLIPGFEVFEVDTPSNVGVESKVDLSPESNGPSVKPRSTLEDDPFFVFEPSIFPRPSEQVAEKDSIQSSFEELDDFIMGRDSRTDGKKTVTNKPSAGLDSNGFQNVDDLDKLFDVSTRPTYTKQDSQFDEEKKTSPATNIGEDYSALFRDVTTLSEEFREIKGESEERRRARLNRHIRTNARVAEALAEKNQRDLQSQQEQEEKHRLAETLDRDIKSWAAGKEGNLRALLSSLQQVLWPECNWRPVSPTDLITSDSVKKVYKKATLYVHPDKVQQKGANLQQKYIAEKVFDLLKEAWNKFSREELR
ncbi:hypothetical protein ABFS82_03G095800 [Erythranthe guttata]|uniref:auxilin-related protein 2-like n=1 Tax=Erythranthe guttata TaxID=4155 RepID=UPI00064DB1E5|nr:PREDICTED: auxilin-related protein 2-like [Erythranthe guttata]|eukprot:XP_012843287.1 PREDICTED: auxilin-related protein 2-like [Erythranthe guttata]